ncbi:curli production assembly/transport protein CsgE [Vibrio sp. TBV020]|uniref:curli production assembly/transport protein CsgE n=1 Tax=Vibrio sp. TBV020 TaxID=3137398 RepID=UPI0038CD12BE
MGRCKVKKRSLYCFSFLLLFFSFAGNAVIENEEKIEDRKRSHLLENEVDGLIIDRTMTRLGDDFYFFFTQLMNERHGSLEENLTVKERPTALSGSIISIVHREKLIYRTALSPGRQHAEDKAKEALNAVTSHLLRWKAQLSYQDTFDLAQDEF